MNIQEATTQFSEAIRATGMQPPVAIEPGKIHRFSDNGNRNKNGWCVFFVNPDGSVGGKFGNWKDVNETWFSGNSNTVSPELRERLRQQIEHARQKAEAERKAEQARAAKKAQRIWTEAKPADPEHPYLKAKMVKPYNIKQSGKALVVPVYGPDRKIKSVQFIYPDGTKRFLKGGEKKGCFGVIGSLKDAEKAYLCEGFATGATIHEATRIPVILAFDAGNLKPVCQSIRRLT